MLPIQLKAHPKSLFLIIVGAAFLIRLSLLAAWHFAGQGERLSSDTALFLEMAQGVVEGKGFLAFGVPSMRRVPLYPLLLALFLKMGMFPVGVQVFQCVLGALTCGLVYGISRQCGFSRTVSFFAFLMMGADYLTAKQCVYILPETFYIFWVVLSFYFLFRAVNTERGSDYFLAALAAGLSVLTKESLSLFYPALSGCLILGRFKSAIRWKCAIFFLGIYVLVLSPWVTRNVLLFKRPVFLTQSAGLTVYLGNNPTVKPQLFGGEWRAGEETQYPDEETTLVSSVYGETDKHYLQLATNFVKEEPIFFIKNSLIKFVRFWYPFYSEAPLVLKIYAGLFNTVIYLFALAGLLWVGWRSPLFYAYPLIAYLSLIHAITIPTIRYRYVLMPFLMILAAFALQKIVFFLRRKGLE